MKLNKQLFGWLGASALLLTTACTNEEFVEPQGTPNQDLTEVYGNGSKIITLSVGSEAAVATRGEDDPTGDNQPTYNISDGSRVNILYFAVYDLGNPNADTDETVTALNGDNDAEELNDPIVYAYKVIDPNIPSATFPVNIRLAVDPENNYRIALWAQHVSDPNAGDNIDTAPFDVKDLTQVVVDYEDATCNDELRDAFCATEKFSGATSNVDIILHRPFAQLNVGTTGADYRNYMEGNILPNKTIAYSKMVVTGVYNCINVATDKISLVEGSNGNYTPATDQTKGKEVTFDFAKLPAFINYDKDYTYTDADKYYGFPNNLLGVKKTTTDNGDENNDKEKYTPNVREQFLYVNLNAPTEANHTFEPFRTYYKTMDNTSANKKYLTETFKYMAMAYVLVPSGGLDENEDNWHSNPSNKNSYDKYKSSTLSSVEVYFAEIQESDKRPTEGTESSEKTRSVDENTIKGYKYFTVRNVPVHRNWRTNLLGGLYDTDKPEDPDDPTSVFYNVKICVNLCPIYFGEYNGRKDPEGVVDGANGFEGIFSGYFPTEEGKDLHNNYGEHNPATEEQE